MQEPCQSKTGQLQTCWRSRKCTNQEMYGCRVDWPVAIEDVADGEGRAGRARLRRSGAGAAPAVAALAVAALAVAAPAVVAPAVRGGCGSGGGGRGSRLRWSRLQRSAQVVGGGRSSGEGAGEAAWRAGAG